MRIKSNEKNYSVNIPHPDFVFYWATPPGAPLELAKRGSSIFTFFVSCLSVCVCVCVWVVLCNVFFPQHFYIRE